MNATANAMELASDRAAGGLLGLAERGLVPDALLRAGIRRMCASRLHDEHAGDPDAAARRNAALIGELRTSPVAIHTDAANRQHYELPPGFFTRCLGPRLKYSGCFYPTGNETLAQAAARETLEEANARVQIGDLYAIYSLPHISQVYILFRAQLLDLDFKPGIESLDVKLLSEHEIPWEEMAFRVIHDPLKHYFKERNQGKLGFHMGVIDRPSGTT